MQRNKLNIFSLSTFFVALAAIVANAGGPLFMWDAENRVPYRYDVTAPVRVYTDLGPFRQVAGSAFTITNERADQITEFAFAQWTAVPTSSFQAQVVGDFASIGLPNITAANAGTVIGPENGPGIHVIYDQDGTILQNFFGVSPSVLGIASPEWADETTGILTESWAVMNGRAVATADTQANAFAGVFTHEFGHAINLAHSQTNGGAAFQGGETRGPGNCSNLPYNSSLLAVSDIETMYPFINVSPTAGSGIAVSTIDRTDDMSAISDLYPDPSYAVTKGSITGQILANDRKTPINGVNVIARNVDAPFVDSTSAMSGDYTRGVAGADGKFVLSGLTPGSRYVIYADIIRAGGFPTRPIIYLPGPEEFYNGASESNDGLTDNPCESEAITVAAGEETEADIALNIVKGAPKFTIIGPNATVNRLTADGNTAAGYILPGGISYKWTKGEGIQFLGQGTTGAFISRDGTAIAGDAPDGTGDTTPSVWNGGTSWTNIPVPSGLVPCTGVGSTYGIGNGGSAVTGFYYASGCAAKPFIWTPAGGVEFLPGPDGFVSARGNKMSGDGSAVVGWWTNNRNGRVGIGWFNGQYLDFSAAAGTTVGEARNTNEDGSIVVGDSAGTDREAWLWDRSRGFEIIGGLSRTTPLESSSGSAISDDGRIVIGGTGRAGFFRPWMWMREIEGGAFNLDEFLVAQGLYLTPGMTLNIPQEISEDGKQFAGLGIAMTPLGRFGYHVDMSNVMVCHAPPGNPANTKSMSVGFPDSMLAHLRHGDTVGLCAESE